MIRKKYLVVLLFALLAGVLFMGCDHDSPVLDTTAPGPVSEVNAVSSEGKILLTWKNPADKDLLGVRISFARGTDSEGEFNQGFIVGREFQKYEIGALEDGISYIFKICAVDACSNESSAAFSNSIVFKSKTFNFKYNDITNTKYICPVCKSEYDTAKEAQECCGVQTEYVTSLTAGTYTIYHMLQDCNDTSYFAFKEEESKNLTETVTLADLKKDYPGFTAKKLGYSLDTVFVYYDRNTITYTFNSGAEGKFLDNNAASLEVSGLYGTKVNQPERIRSATHYFVKWIDVPQTFGTEPLSFNAEWKTLPDGFVMLNGDEVSLCNVNKINKFLMADKEVTYARWKEVKDWATANGYSFANEGLVGSGKPCVTTIGGNGLNSVDDVEYPETGDEVIYTDRTYNFEKHFNVRTGEYYYYDSGVKKSLESTEGYVVSVDNNGNIFIKNGEEKIYPAKLSDYSIKYENGTTEVYIKPGYEGEGVYHEKSSTNQGDLIELESNGIVYTVVYFKEESSEFSYYIYDPLTKERKDVSVKWEQDAEARSGNSQFLYYNSNEKTKNFIFYDADKNKFNDPKIAKYFNENYEILYIHEQAPDVLFNKDNQLYSWKYYFSGGNNPNREFGKFLIYPDLDFILYKGSTDAENSNPFVVSTSGEMVYVNYNKFPVNRDATGNSYVTYNEKQFYYTISENGQKFFVNSSSSDVIYSDYSPKIKFEVKWRRTNLDENHPVTSINWRDAVVWCNAASEKDGLEPVYYLAGTTDFSQDWRVIRTSEGSYRHVPENGKGQAENAVINPNANGYRLPTDAEWEYAARGGDKNSDAWNYTYPGSNNIEDVAWNFENAHKRTHVVGSKAANSIGIFDMCGNAAEYIWIEKGTLDGSGYGQITGRGGGFDTPENACTVSYKTDPVEIKYCFNDAGFRVVRSIVGE